MAELGSGQGYYNQGGNTYGYVGQGGNPGSVLRTYARILGDLGYQVNTNAELYAVLEDLSQQGWTFSGAGPITSPDGQVYGAGDGTTNFADSGGNPVAPPVEEEPGVLDGILGNVCHL